jgi:hypothetical protein
VHTCSHIEFVEARLQFEPIRARVVSAHRDYSRNTAASLQARQVNDEVNRQRDRLPNVVVRQSDVGSQDAVR